MFCLYHAFNPFWEKLYYSAVLFRYSPCLFHAFNPFWDKLYYSTVLFRYSPCLFHAFNPFWDKLYQNPVQFFSIIPRGVPLPHSNVLQYCVKREKFKVSDVIFPSGCEARAINLGNNNKKIGIFTGATS